MTGRMAAPCAAFALAVAYVAHGAPLPEFFVQLRDPNVLAALPAGALLHVFGYAFVSAAFAVFAAGSVLLSAWRTRIRGATSMHAGLAAALVALCIAGRAGTSFDAIAWLGTAIVALVLEKGDRRAWYALIPFVFIWSVMENGATVAAVLAVIALAGNALDRNVEPGDLRGRLFACAGIVVVALVQPHLSPLRGYGIHWLYLDGFLPGAQRDSLRVLPLNASGIGVLLTLILAAWYGIRRRAKSADALSFVVFFVLAVVEVRNAPFFGIVCAPIVADAIASYYVAQREVPMLTLASYAFTAAGLAAVFVAAVTIGEPRTVAWPTPREGVAPLAATLARDGSPHTVVCEAPRWCDTVVAANVRTLLDDRAGLAAPADRLAQRSIARARGPWEQNLATHHVDAVIASTNDPIAGLLAQRGWRERARDAGGRILFLEPRAR